MRAKILLTYYYCNGRCISIALSQGGLQSTVKSGIMDFEHYIKMFIDCVTSILGHEKGN